MNGSRIDPSDGLLEVIDACILTCLEKLRKHFIR
jgi:hypothetical protein